MRTLTLLFIALAIAGALTGHMGGALVALVWAGLCMYAHYALERAPTVQGCGVPVNQVATNDTEIETK